MEHKFPYLWKLKELPPPITAMCFHVLRAVAVALWGINWLDST